MYNELKLFNDVVKAMYNKEYRKGRDYNKQIIISKNNTVISPNCHSLYYVFSETIRNFCKGVDLATKFDTDKIYNFMDQDKSNMIPLKVIGLKPTDTYNAIILETDNGEKAYINEDYVTRYFGKSYMSDLKFYGTAKNTPKSPIYIASDSDSIIAMILPINMQ